MNYSKYRFNLDMQSYISQISLPVRQNDTGIVLRINLTDGGVPYTIKDGCMAMFFARKADGNPLLNTCVIENNTTICYELTQQTTVYPGVVDCEIRLYGSDGNIITTPRFILVVDSRVVHDEDFPLSDSEKDLLDNILITEAERQGKEALREQNHAKMLETTARATAAAETLEQKLATGDFDGITPHIGENLNWWFDDEDTGILARGITPHIGANGHWWFNDVDSGVEADAGKHTHSTEDITEGTLPISRGGTGANNGLDALRNLGAFEQFTFKAPRGTATALVTKSESISGYTTYNIETTLELNFDFKPRLIILRDRKEYNAKPLFFTEDLVFDHIGVTTNGKDKSGNTCILSDNGNVKIMWYKTSPSGYSIGYVDKEYDYIAIGNSTYEDSTPPDAPEGGEDVELVTFSIRGYDDYQESNAEYSVAEGTTWSEWCDSTYSEADDMCEYIIENDQVYNYFTGAYVYRKNGVAFEPLRPDEVVTSGEYFNVYYSAVTFSVDELGINYIPITSTYTVVAGTTWREAIEYGVLSTEPPQDYRIGDVGDYIDGESSGYDGVFNSRGLVEDAELDGVIIAKTYTTM